LFLRGESVTVDLPDSTPWRLVDYDDQAIDDCTGGTAFCRIGEVAGRLYRLRSVNSARWISLAVIEPLKTLTPATSRSAWMRDGLVLRRKADWPGRSLCALAGVNRVRDRTNLGGTGAPTRSVRPEGKYDISTKLQTEPA